MPDISGSDRGENQGKQNLGDLEVPDRHFP